MNQKRGEMEASMARKGERLARSSIVSIMMLQSVMVRRKIAMIVAPAWGAVMLKATWIYGWLVTPSTISSRSTT